jgi:hypothetical protein
MEESSALARENCLSNPLDTCQPLGGGMYFPARRSTLSQASGVGDLPPKVILDRRDFAMRKHA